MTDNVVTVREFWDRKVDNVITRFYYTGDTEALIEELSRLGYDPEVIEDVLDEWNEDYN